MLKLRELWIGEDVKLKSSNKKGKFEGIGAQNHAFVRIDGKMHLIEAKDLEIYTEDEAPIQIDLPPQPSQSKQTIKTDIDLHINILNPSMANADPNRILAYQVEKAKSHLEAIIERKLHTAKIIHGKGNGQLKNEVHHLLGDYNQVNHFHVINDGGATEILFSYF